MSEARASSLLVGTRGYKRMRSSTPSTITAPTASAVRRDETEGGGAGPASTSRSAATRRMLFAHPEDTDDERAGLPCAAWSCRRCSGRVRATNMHRCRGRRAIAARSRRSRRWTARPRSTGAARPRRCAPSMPRTGAASTTSPRTRPTISTRPSRCSAAPDRSWTCRRISSIRSVGTGKAPTRSPASSAWPIPIGGAVRSTPR